MATIKTGYEVPDYSKQSTEISSPAKDNELPKKIVYPEISLRGPCAEAIAAAYAAGEEFEVTAKFKMVALHQRKGSSSQYGGEDSDSVELELISIDHEDIQTGDSDEEDAGSAVDKYRQSKAAATEEED